MLIRKFFIIFLMFFSINVYSKNLWTIKNIELQGLRYVSKEEVLKNILFNIGSTISNNDIKKSIKSLFQTGKFEDIKVFFSEQSLIFKIIERPLIHSINISGNHIIEDITLNKYLKELGIEIGKQYNPYLKDILIKNIKNFYNHVGKYQSKIQLLTSFSANNKINLKILINEGNVIQVNNIKIIGNNNISQNKIISLFKLKDHKNWWNILEKCIYSADQLDKDIYNLNKFYLSQGYYYFHIDKKVVHFLKNQNKVNIILKIHEGNQYKISHFFVNGNVLQYYKKIKNFININHNELYNKEKIDFIVQKIKYFLSEYGYINAQILIDPIINVRKKNIVLNFNINVNQRYFVNKIYFRGNEYTQDIVLRRQIKQIEGEWFNSKLIDLGKASLEKIKYLNNVQVKKNFLYNKKNAVNIIYEVQELPTGNINFGLGYGKDSGLSFNASIAKDNLFGSGNSVKVSIIKNDNQKYADFFMTFPYFFNNDTSFNTRLFYHNFQYHLDNKSALCKKTVGFESDISFLINNFNQFNIGLGYSRNKVINNNSKTESINKNNLLKGPNEIISDQLLTNNLVNDFTINYSFLHNTLKNLYFPFSGNETYLSGKHTIPGSDNKFYKFLLDTQQYIPLDQEKEFIFLSHLRIGFGDSFNHKKLPFYENFHSNSSNNIRGFRLNTIGPKKSYTVNNLSECIGNKNNNICESLDSIGGNAIFIANLEFIFPIPFIKKEYTNFLRSSFFIDAGNIWDTKAELKNNIVHSNFLDFKKFKDIYSSFGMALQWMSPIGPLVFSYAYPIQKHENNQLEAFQFNIGKNW